MQDVVYYFVPSQDCTVNISLCNSQGTEQPFDTILSLLGGTDAAPLCGVTCNDDFCGMYSQLTVRLFPLPVVPLRSLPASSSCHVSRPWASMA